jgi:hypothetical protein
VLDGVDMVLVIALTPDHDVGAGEAAQHIVPCEALEALGAHKAYSRLSRLLP